MWAIGPDGDSQEENVICMVPATKGALSLVDYRHCLAHWSLYIALHSMWCADLHTTLPRIMPQNKLLLLVLRSSPTPRTVS